MKIVSPALLGLSLAVVGSSFAAAQQMHTPPKVLEIEREVIKPGKSGAIHDKSESKFVAAMAAAKWPTHYIALNSMSGNSAPCISSAMTLLPRWKPTIKPPRRTPRCLPLSIRLVRLTATCSMNLTSLCLPSIRIELPARDRYRAQPLHGSFVIPHQARSYEGVP